MKHKVGALDYAILAAEPWERLKATRYVIKTKSCWLHQGLIHSGYGRVRVQGKQVFLHRAMKIWEEGRSMPGLLACHIETCLNRNCVNPSHIYWGSFFDNLRDRTASGRAAFFAARGIAVAGAKLTEAQAEAIFLAYKDQNKTCAEIAKHFGVTQSTVSHIGVGASWSHVTKKFGPIIRRSKKTAKIPGYRASIFTWTDVDAMRAMKKAGAKTTAIAEKFGGNYRTVQQIINMRAWKEENRPRD